MKTGRVRIRVVCLECGRKFSTHSMLPECPKCGGSDIELQHYMFTRRKVRK